MSQGKERVRQYDMWAFSACHQKHHSHITIHSTHDTLRTVQRNILQREQSTFNPLPPQALTIPLCWINCLHAQVGEDYRNYPRNTWRAFVFISTVTQTHKKDFALFYLHFFKLHSSISSCQNLLITYAHSHSLIDHYIKSLLSQTHTILFCFLASLTWLM